MHVDRLMNAARFIRRCGDLNVEVSLDELEHYEKIGAMMPVVRVVYPDEFVIRQHRGEADGETESGWLEEWPSVLSLMERDPIFPHDYADLPDERLVHWFDRAADEGGNPHLFVPDAERFTPWSEYHVVVDDGFGNDLELPTAEHYYGCWQVHQVHYILRFPDLYRNAWLIGFIPDDHPLKDVHPWSPPLERLADFQGKWNCFDALSFWATVYRRERDRTFAGVDPVGTMRRIDPEQAAEHRGRLLGWANHTMGRFGLNVEDIYQFIRQLVELHEDYKDAERHRLAEALTQEIFACEHLLLALTGENRALVSDRLGSQRQAFRHLSPATRERDYAQRQLEFVARGCARNLRELGCLDWSFTATDAAALLRYCDRVGLGLVSTAFSGLIGGDEEYRQKSRRVWRYTNLKNVLTSYEYLLKSLAAKDGGTLTGVVWETMKEESWFGLFKGGRFDPNGNYLLGGNSVQKFLSNLDVILADDRLDGSVDGYWARQFLITCLARNMAVHSYPSDDRYYGDVFGLMLDAVTAAMLHTWKLSEGQRWAQPG